MGGKDTGLDGEGVVGHRGFRGTWISTWNTSHANNAPHLFWVVVERFSIILIQPKKEVFADFLAMLEEIGKQMEDSLERFYQDVVHAKLNVLNINT